jgi:ketosteroid isomerase-like protein
VKTDVFGKVAVVTALYDYEAVMAGERMGGRLRVTAVMVEDDGDWKIAHEHVSPLPASA